MQHYTRCSCLFLPAHANPVALCEAEAAATYAHGAVGPAPFAVGEAARFNVSLGLNSHGANADQGHGEDEGKGEDLHVWRERAGF